MPKTGRANITRGFVQYWSGEYDRRFRGKKDQIVESALRAWLDAKPEPKYLDKDNFVKLGYWKSPRQGPNYRRNEEDAIIDVTIRAYQSSDPTEKMQLLDNELIGVGVPVASTILHFFHPDQYAIFDVRARTTLSKAGIWRRPVGDASIGAWLEYLDIMRGLASQCGVDLRTLDKALWAYDKWDP